MPAHLDLVKEELRELGEVVHRMAGDPPEPFGVYAFAATEPESLLARAIERSVFDEFFGNSPELLAAEYGPYEGATVFLCVLDHRRLLPAGMMRLILPSAAGFKTLDDLENAWRCPIDEVLARSNLLVDLERVWDIGTLAVAPDYRGKGSSGLVSLALYQALGVASRWANARWLVAILDLLVLDLIQQVTGDAFARFAGVEPQRYLDSPSSLPVWCDLEQYFPRLAKSDPSMYALFGEGHGLEAAVRPLAGGEILDLSALV
jgi:GNAT superfamily N-acetyltransferase